MIKRLFALLLAAALMLALPVTAAEPVTRFSDISGSGTEAMTVESLRLMGVMDGYANGTFRPNGELTRAQFCKMAIGVLNAESQLGLYRTVTVFPDVKPSYWAAAYINMSAKGLNIISGYPDGKFYPDRIVTLGQACTILLRVLGYKDGNVGGVWPDSYLGAAARAGLLEGIDPVDGPLTRRTAATLFLNLLRADTFVSDENGSGGSSGGSFLSSLGLKLEEGVVLVSSSATGPDGKDTALQLADGRVFQLANDKVSSGVFNGYKGTLVMKNDKVLTFLPDEKGVSRVITISSATTRLITDISGVKYPVAEDTKAYYEGKEKDWSEVCTWLNPGASLTLYLGTAGNVEYIFVGGGNTASEAVIVYEKGSDKGFSALVGNQGGYQIYKNGSLAKPSELRPYDVATYSHATNTIRVCDNRLSGYYESCTPSPDEPKEIVLMGHKFPVLTTAQETLSRFKPGDMITLLLTEDNQVAGAVKDGTAGAAPNPIGVVKEASASSAKVELLCGITIKGRTDLGSADLMQLKNQLVRVSSSYRGNIGLVRLGGGVSGSLDVQARRLGNTNLASGVKLYRLGSDGLQLISFDDLGAGPISNSEISYAHTNWANQIDIIVLGGDSRSNVFYGRTSVTMQGDGDNITYMMELYNPQGRTQAFRLPASYAPGASYAMLAPSDDGSGFPVAGRGLCVIKDLEKLSDVPNTAWSGRGAVTVGGRTYTIAANVMCYNRDIIGWITLDQAHAYSKTCQMFVSEDGVVRAIEVGGRN